MLRRPLQALVVSCVTLALALASGALIGCSQERDPINRVQADTLSKEFFVNEIGNPDDDPEFYMRVTVVDVASGGNSDGLFTHSDAQPTARVRWEISEALLLARLTYELIDNTDGAGRRRTPDGQIVAAYGITKHFDIVRGYNESTGEDNNIIVENDEDRPWYEREYFRVDWSRNLVTTAYNLDTMAQLGIYYGVEWEPISYYVSDPSHPDAPTFDNKSGYFDVTNKAWAQPVTYEDPYWGTTPVCWDVGFYPVYSCNPAEVTLRQAYKKVTDTDYEPLLYDGTSMDMFGYFTVDRLGYDRRYGVVDDQWRRFATRWNIWDKSHAYPPVQCDTADTTPIGADPHRDDDGDGTEDECASVGRGSRCDDVVGECTIPFRDRTVRTIPWHVNREHPDDLFESSLEALQSWNDAMRSSVVVARLTECRRTGEAGCEAQMGWPARWSDDYVPPLGDASLAEVPNIFVLCHNPVQDGDDESCGKEGTSPRLGDIRFNILTVVTDYELMSPWGIMMDVEDPLTGEKVAGSATVWAATLDRAAANLADLLGLLNGTIDPTEYIEGEDISQWVETSRGGDARRYGPPMSEDEVARRHAAFDMQKVVGDHLAGMAQEKPNLHPRARRKARAQALVDDGRLGIGNAALEQRMQRLRGTNIEAMMISPEVMQLAGYDPTGAVNDDVIHRASPFGRMNPAARRAKERDRRLGHAQRHSCRYEGPDPDNLLGLAQALLNQFPAPDPEDPAAVNAHRQQVYDWARRAFNRGVMAHEIGHSVGLRHNFAASWDALNYGNEYWQLRTNGAAVVDDCVDGNTDGEICVGPRWRDPITPLEQDGNIGKFGTTSVMDYPGDQNQDTILPGKFDRAAVRFAYANTVDVWNMPGVSLDGTGAELDTAWKLTAFTLSPGLTGVYWFPTPNPDPDIVVDYQHIHYSQWQSEFGLISDCQADDTSATGVRCLGAPLDVVDQRDMEDWIDDPDYAVYDFFLFPKARETNGGRVRRGYHFSSDEYADAGNVPSFSDDAGADAYEQVRFLETLYELRYPLDAFRRDRVTFNSQDVVWRIQARYLDNIQLIAKTFAFGALLDGDPSAPSPEFLEDGNYGPLVLAGTLALDLFARQLTRPEPGYYCPADFCGSFTPVGMENEMYVADAIALPDVYLYDYQVLLGDGRYLHNDFDYSQGYFWGDYQKQVGAYYDKIWAVYYLGEAYDYFISNAKEDFTDSRYKNVNFATVFPDQVRRLYNALLTDDYDTYAPWTVPGTSADTPIGTLQYPLWSDAADVGVRPNNGLLADPNYSWNEQIYAMVWGSIFFPTTWSNDFIHGARITTNIYDTPWQNAEIYAFFNPASGITYRARRNGTEDVLGYTRQKAAGARMLEWANKLLTIAYLVQTDVNGDPILDPFGTPLLVPDINGQAQLNPANPGADLVLAKYVDTIDQMKQLTDLFSLPLDDESLPQP